MLLSPIKSIWLYPMIVDFRKQLDGLIVIIVDALIKIHHLVIYLYLEIGPAISLNVFTLMGGAFGCFIAG